VSVTYFLLGQLVPTMFDNRWRRWSHTVWDRNDDHDRCRCGYWTRYRCVVRLTVTDIAAQAGHIARSAGHLGCSLFQQSIEEVELFTVCCCAVQLGVRHSVQLTPPTRHSQVGTVSSMYGNLFTVSKQKW